jgi:hypothetical protein
MVHVEKKRKADYIAKLKQIREQKKIEKNQNSMEKAMLKQLEAQ